MVCGDYAQHKDTQTSVLYNGSETPKVSPVPSRGGSGPRLFTGLTQVHIQTASRSVHPFFCGAYGFVQHASIDLSTSLIIGRMLYYALRGGLEARITHTHTHTHLMAICPRLPGWPGTRKVKPIWILLKQETVSGSGISWAVCKSAPRSTDNHASTPSHHSVFCTSCRPTNSVKVLKAFSSKNYYETDPESRWRVWVRETWCTVVVAAVAQRES